VTARKSDLPGVDLTMGKQKRHFGRVKCNLHGITNILLEHNGRTVETLLDDISFTGARITLIDGVPSDLNVGDECYLAIKLDYNSNPIEHACQVTRRDSACVGLNFLS
jgi:hypothetical protein